MKKTFIIFFSIFLSAMVILGILNLVLRSTDTPYLWGGHMMPGGAIGFGFIGMLLFWGFIIYLILTLTQNNTQSGNDQTYTLSSREILDKKYVRGEITEQEYLRKKQTLNEGGHHNA
jgi:putative membrane protein